METFTYSSVIPTTMDAMVTFHTSKDAFKKLNMPPIIPQIHRDTREGLTKGTMEFTLWMGPIPIRWKAVHEPGPTPTSFVDVQTRGPMTHWRHTHTFEETPEGIRLTDQIELEHPKGLSGIFTRMLFGRLPLEIFFTYRHWVTRRETRTV